MIKKFKIKSCELSFVFKHKFKKKDPLDLDSVSNKWKLGLWFDKGRIVGRKNFSDVNQWSNNIVNEYTVGADLIMISMFVG